MTEDEAIIEIDKVSTKIYAAMRTTDHSDIAWMALTSTMMIFLSEVCPSCRRKMGQKLKANLGVMLAQAEQMAVDAPDHQSMCH
jgi:hypothetical protein